MGIVTGKVDTNPVYGAYVELAQTVVYIAFHRDCLYILLKLLHSTSMYNNIILSSVHFPASCQSS